MYKLKYLCVGVLVFFFPFMLNAQQVQLQSPPLAGKEAKLYYYTGATGDSLLSVVDSSGKASFDIPSGNYRGMAALIVPGAGGVELVVAEPTVIVECADNELNTQTVGFAQSKENNFLKHIFTAQSRSMQQQAWLQAGSELLDANSPLLSAIPPELIKVNASMQALDKEIASSELYAARYYRLADFMNRLFDTEQKRDSEGAKAIRQEMEESVDITSLYHSGQLWGSVLNFYLSLFNHTAGTDKQQQYAASVLKISQRLPASSYEAFLAGCVTETERFGWQEAQDGILAGLHPQYIPDHRNLQRALGAYRARNSKTMPALVGLAEADTPYTKTLLAFYDSDCGNCVNEMFRLVTVYPKLKDKGIRVVSIAADKDREKYENGIKDFLWKDKLCDFEGFEGVNFSNYNVIGTPSFYLLEKDGKLSGQFFKVEDIVLTIENN
ncbi:peroxiredoxin [Dysgonomonas sp. PFB1-18]|uniref:peroxiredoxin family protein n=1 Tax=unclassified Dysgonomonas TaxID=2630389 RepID=UPI00247315BE|nr:MULTISPECIES: thioredoxin family protein [unclassified Dysgonomonas]MDH6311144.1 peroxiredoxin [Dysgonomonas sp. PF1-14]MDH6341002.1 peroxiredoxin [Dysgonomonas sp. PF1-16]MDH6382642.1 peroxiredoxin [Dysgonomonas sp. PFB1-18]MDH6400009.1 peroxiredoxin [Dysgonomonas sp. PF1-23]